MSEIAIRVENLSKQYRIGRRHQYKTIRDSVMDAVSARFRRAENSDALSTGNGEGTRIWSLKDVSFDVTRGEVVGIIGRNGAGKSTLLKILSRITEPTQGHVQLRGRVGSLLEVGTGFHVELTGRENIYLSGAILGMRRREIERKFDEIVAFAEMEKFLDTPSKRYSSGMYMRLAFSVAAHLDPAILLVDEVLAVGDAAFQRKCLGKLGEVAEAGRTVLFVSHNMAAIRKLCPVTILFDKGQLVEYGRTQDVLQTYEAEAARFSLDTTSAFPMVNQEWGVALESVVTNIQTDTDHAHLEIRVWVRSERLLNQLGVALTLHTPDGVLVTRVMPLMANNFVNNAQGNIELVFRAECIEQYLAAGDYWLSLELRIPRGERILFAESVALISVPPFDIFGTGMTFEKRLYGVVPLQLRLTQPDPDSTKFS